MSPKQKIEAKSLKQKIEENLTLTVLGLLCTGFVAGFSASKLFFPPAPTTTSVSTPSENKNQGSPFVHWWSGATHFSLQQCEDLIRDVYRLTGTERIESPVTDENSFAQVGLAGSVTSVIVCARVGGETSVTIISSGPDQTDTDTRHARVRDLVQARRR